MYIKTSNLNVLAYKGKTLLCEKTIMLNLNQCGTMPKPILTSPQILDRFDHPTPVFATSICSGLDRSVFFAHMSNACRQMYLVEPSCLS